VLSRHEKLHGPKPSSETAEGVMSPPRREIVPTAVVAEAAEGVRDLLSQANKVVAFAGSPSQQTPISMPHLSPENVLPNPQPWMESGDMLEMLMSDFTTSWPMSLPLPVMPVQSFPASNPSIPYHPIILDQLSDPPNTAGPGHQAMDQMSRLISELSASLTAEIQSKGITSAFLDTCVHVFFDRFIPSFPILNKATFIFRESSHPLLLNIMALGSLFVGAKDAVLKGESLWKLAHTAVATNWSKLMTTRGPRDRCKGVQLILTALTGQTYAILSQNESIRSTAQIFHGLGFSWAKQCGMYEEEEALPTLPLNTCEADKVEAWKIWMAREVQNRAVLGHYILDGHIAQFSGNSSCARHVTNPLFLPASDDAFMAKTADDWIREMAKLDATALSFREIFVVLCTKESLMANIPISSFGIRVILEGFQSLVSDVHEANGPAIGTPSKREICEALLKLYREQLCYQDTPSVETMELLIRWHSVCLDLATATTKLCRNMCLSYFIQQQLHDGTDRVDASFDLAEWTQTRDARRALLHAMAIQDIVERLPLGRSHALHLPAGVFAASTIYSGFCLEGTSSVSYPVQFHWEDVWAVETKDATRTMMLQDPAIERFLQGRYRSGVPGAASKNLIYDLNSLQIMLNSLSRWGVSNEMGTILQGWMSAASHEP
jgi:Fungal specific transcription factor domain